MQQLKERQQKILDYILRNKSASNSDIVEYLNGSVSRYTALRDLELLVKKGLIKKTGKGRGVSYSIDIPGNINAYFEPDLYFKKGPDERVAKTEFNLEVVDELAHLFKKEEIKELKEYNDRYLKKIKLADKEFLKKEIERLIIELSWKSSQIEGNTYSLIDTEILIKERIEAKGHKKEEAIMILNHKNAIDYIFQNKKRFKTINLSQIEEIHWMLVSGLGVKRGIRDFPVRIIGTRYTPIEGRENIIEVLQISIDKINSLKDPFSKALGIVLLLSYIQPFGDGNKRTARIMGNAVLLTNNMCPLSYRGVDEAEYKKAIVLFYEQNSARYFKDIFTEQFKFAVDNYF